MRVLSVIAGVAADRFLGEPPDAIHPVARFGQVMAGLEDRMWADRRASGVAYAALGVGSAALLGCQASRRHPVLGVAAATFTAVAARSLTEAAEVVRFDLARGDLASARADVRALVGRDPSHMDETDVVRAVVESVAENTADAVTAPLLWALVGGAPAVSAYRAANTLDAMVGHHSDRYERFGWAAARLDDLLNWVPARLTALAVAAVRPRRARAVWRAVKDQAPQHPSPNAGVVEGAFAAALGVRLGGINDYAGRLEVRPPLGEGRPPETQDIDRALRLSRDAAGAVLLVAGLTAIGWRR
jgi:adenosylcobinamide-phosphate synthase